MSLVGRIDHSGARRLARAEKRLWKAATRGNDAAYWSSLTSTVQPSVSFASRYTSAQVTSSIRDVKRAVKHLRSVGSDERVALTIRIQALEAAEQLTTGDHAFLSALVRRAPHAQDPSRTTTSIDAARRLVAAVDTVSVAAREARTAATTADPAIREQTDLLARLRLEQTAVDEAAKVRESAIQELSKAVDLGSLNEATQSRVRTALEAAAETA